MISYDCMGLSDLVFYYPSDANAYIKVKIKYTHKEGKGFFASTYVSAYFMLIHLHRFCLCLSHKGKSGFSSQPLPQSFVVCCAIFRQSAYNAASSKVETASRTGKHCQNLQNPKIE